MPTYLKKGREVLDLEIEALREIRQRMGREFTATIEALEATVSKKGKIVLTGVGKSGHIGRKAAATFTSTGAPSVFLNPLDAEHGDLGLISKGDVLIALSYRGETEELNQLLPLARKTVRSIISLTGEPASTLGRISDIILNTRVEREACPHNLAPTSSTTAMLAMTDAMAMTLLQARGFGKNEFAQLHPGGTLGRHLLTRASDVMRPLATVAQLNESELVQTSVQAMAEKRCGACVVLTAKKSLAGIYTHGDFSRGYLKDPEIGKQPLGKVMTRRPITANQDQLASEVLQLLEKHRIDDIVVLAARRRPVGLIDIQDLARLKIA
jgi:arabinose-5-phosphate isomerase